jgi:hypothetical protein
MAESRPAHALKPAQRNAAQGNTTPISCECWLAMTRSHVSLASTWCKQSTLTVPTSGEGYLGAGV